MIEETAIRARYAGAGRPTSSMADPTVLTDLRGLVEPATMGDPMRPLLWVSKSREKLAVALRALNHAVSATTVAKMLTVLGYSRQVNRKTKDASRLLITADGGGSNGSRVRLWKLALQKLADGPG